MFSKRSQGQVSVSSAQMKCLILFGLAFYYFQNIHASQHCNSMSESGSVCVTITNPPRPNITDDERKSLRCSWDTSSFDFYEWTFNGSHLSSGRFNLGQTHNDLTIQGSPQTHGEYRCVVARKGNTGDREIAKLFIYYFPHIVFEEPINRINPTTDDFSVGEPLSYTCTATNHDRKMWTDRYKNPIVNTTDGRITVTTGHTDSLTINHVTHADAKEYYCFAVVYSLNDSGPVIQELHLFRPVVVHGRPFIMCHKPSKAVTPGSLVSFVCKVQAFPEPVSISWNGSRERTNVSNVGIRNTFYAFKVIVNAWNSTLSFKDFVEVDDSGLYTITARNMHGEFSTTVELQVLHIPGSLMQPVVTALSATRVRVSWKEPENKDALELLHYMVLYGVVGSQRQQVNVSADELDVELAVLPVTEYYFVVGAVNRLGTGDLSHRETITTETSVPVAPVSVTVDMSTVTPESAIVTWSPLTGAYTGGFDIVRYIVSYKREDEEWYMAQTLDAEPDVSQVTVGDLEPLSAYIASVKGVNALGEGFPAESQIFYTPELYAPSSPSDVTPLKSSSADSSVALNVCWTPGPDSYHVQTYQILVYQRSNGSQLQLYKVVYVTADSVQVVQRQECTLVSGLQTDSCYWFSVAAHNAAGASNASHTSDSSSCTVSGLSSGLEDILREPEVLAPIVIAVVIVAILTLLCVAVCIVRRNTRRKGSGLYDATESSQWGTNQQQSAVGCDSLTSIRGSGVATCSPHGNPNQTTSQFLDRKANLPRPSQLAVDADLCKTLITPDSGIPSLSTWDKMDFGPAANYHPPQGSVVDNEISNEAEKLIQWTPGPAHESRDTPPIVDRSVSVDQSDSGLDNGEDVSHFDHQVSNPDQYGSEMDFQYTDNVAYGAVSSHRHAGSSEQLRGTQKQSVGVIASHIQFTEQTVGATEWDSAPDHRPFVVTLRQDPNCRDKEYVTFRQPPRVPPKSHTSSSSLQTSL